MNLPINTIIQGNCIDVLANLPEQSVDLIFADPPYNLQLSQELWRPNFSRVDAVDDAWDQFDSFSDYDEFTRAWLSGCQRVLKDTGTIWIIGSYHNIYRIGTILQDLNYWVLNDIVWIKTNPMPNFRGVRFANAHETLIWASKFRGAKYTFNHHAMKEFNNGKQMRSDWTWEFPICTGNERIKINGEKAHSTQKPEALLYRVLLSSSKPKDIILDPFFGTGTTGAVAKQLHRNWVGIEREESYVEVANHRIEAITPQPFHEDIFDTSDKKRLAPRVPFARLLEIGWLKPGQPLFFRGNTEITAHIKPDGKLLHRGEEGSIHKIARQLLNGSPCNGWDLWYYANEKNELVPIDQLRALIRKKSGGSAPLSDEDRKFGGQDDH